MTSTVSIPNYLQPLVVNGQTSRSWYQFFTTLQGGTDLTAIEAQIAAIEAQVTSLEAGLGNLITRVSFLESGLPPANEGVTAGASPFTYTAAQKGFMIITGGTVSQVQWARAATWDTGVTHGCFPLSTGDRLITTYTVAPTFIFATQ